MIKKDRNQTKHKEKIQKLFIYRFIENLCEINRDKINIYKP